MKIALYQGHFPVAHIEENVRTIIEAAHQAKADGVEILFFPELALSGYLPEDLLLHAEFRTRLVKAFEQIKQAMPDGIVLGVGMPVYRNDQGFNALLMLKEGEVLYEYHKQILPNFGVFDEKRYFTPGNQPGIFEYNGHRIALMICEDAWHDESLMQLEGQPLDLIVSINASPYEQAKRELRIKRMQKAIKALHAPLLYVHQVGMQDECIYDGGSFYLNAEGDFWVLPQFQPCLASILQGFDPQEGWKREFALEPVAEVYKALCFALKNYVDHYKFPGVLVGLSGGIDSALTLAIAVDALGPSRVQAVMMPSRYSASMSLEDAKWQAEASGVDYKIIPIETLFTEFLNQVSPAFHTQAPDLTEENIQSRLRGMILMALSNKSGKMVVATTNKSEASVGYGTLYGDLIGGLMLLKDVYKTQVYQLAHYRNSLGRVIPERVITRAPSAELREDQTDQDSLPDYGILDQILKAYIEENQAPAEIKANLKIDSKEVDRVISMVIRSEYKRKQAPFGPKLSVRAFGKDWRMPIMV